MSIIGNPLILPSSGGGGGGASNVVTGSFTAASTSGAQSISIPYTGSGYPIFIGIYPDDGFVSGSSLYGITRQFAVIEVAIFKSDPSGVPTYTGSGTNNSGYVIMLNKGDSGTNTSVNRTSGSSTFTTTNASSGVGTAVRMSSNKVMSVYVSETSSGFLINTTYRYVIVYSS